MLYYMSPPIVYKGSQTDLWFDPKNIMDVTKDIPEEELPFINVKVGEANADFEDRVTYETTFKSYSRNRVRATITDQILSDTQSITMMWETGKSLRQPVEMKTCNYDESFCYDTRTVAMIESVSMNTGYITGGQNLTITGNGFDNSTIDITVDGVSCPVTQFDKTTVSCTTQTAA